MLKMKMLQKMLCFMNNQFCLCSLNAGCCVSVPLVSYADENEIVGRWCDKLQYVGTGIFRGRVGNGASKFST